MKPRPGTSDKSSRGELTVRLLIVMAMVFSLMAVTIYGSPSWWVSRGAVNPGATTNDYAGVNEGQVKQFTVRAVYELNADLPGYGAGTNLNGLVNCWSNDYATNGYNATNLKPADFHAMKVGQVKTIASCVWRQLVAAGYTNSLPSWLDVNSGDFQAANIGQIKTVFAFDLLYSSLTNGLPDWWQTHYFGSVGAVSPGSLAPNGDQLTVLQNYQYGINPTNYYNGILPTLTIVSGNNQSGTSGAMLANPLIVEVNDGSTALENAPLTFTMTSSNGVLATTSSGSLATSQSVVTGTNGQASVYLELGGSTGAVNAVEAVATPKATCSAWTYPATATRPMPAIPTTR